MKNYMTMKDYEKLLDKWLNSGPQISPSNVRALRTICEVAYKDGRIDEIKETIEKVPGWFAKEKSN